MSAYALVQKLRVMYSVLIKQSGSRNTLTSMQMRGRPPGLNLPRLLDREDSCT